MLPHIKPEHSGYIAWRGLVNESDIPRSTLTKLANKFSFALTDGGHWLGYLVAGPNDDLAEGKDGTTGFGTNGGQLFTEKDSHR